MARQIEIVPSRFDHIERGARLCIVGQTPGDYQHQVAMRAFDDALMAGHTPEEASRMAKFAASFSGKMRNTLCDMLDHVGVARAFGVRKSEDLFQETVRGKLHFTSALRNPVFVGEKRQNYNGAPSMIRHPDLLQVIETHLAEEARALPDAYWLPLGDKPVKALTHLVGRGLLKKENVLPHLPHPSTANMERIQYFLGHKTPAELSDKTPPGPIDERRSKLMRVFETLKFSD